jgi:hypothetical protein
VEQLLTTPKDGLLALVIQFLNAENICPLEIYHHLVEVLGEGVMNEGNVHKWCRLFIGGRIDVHNEA